MDVRDFDFRITLISFGFTGLWLSGFLGASQSDMGCGLKSGWAIGGTYRGICRLIGAPVTYWWLQVGNKGIESPLNLYITP